MKKQTTALLIAAGMILSMGSMAQAETNGVAHTGGHFAAAASKHLVMMNMVEEDAMATLNAEINRKEMKSLLEKVVGKTVADSNASAEKVTRVEVAQWIAASLPPMNTGINGHNLAYPYKDTPNVTAEQRSAAHELYKLGIMVGDGKGNFLPNATLTRGEAAVLLDNVLSRTMTGAQAVAFEKLTDQLPETVYTVMNENKYTAGVSFVEEGGFKYIIVSGGEQPNGGYSVNVDEVVETDAGIFVDAKVQGPEPGMMHAQVISYPVQVIKVKTSKKAVYQKGSLEALAGAAEKREELK